jgi:hypothetical protein
VRQKWATSDEKNRITLACRALLVRIAAENGWGFFTHDPDIAAARIARSADGRYSMANECRALS